MSYKTHRCDPSIWNSLHPNTGHVCHYAPYTVFLKPTVSSRPSVPPSTMLDFSPSTYLLAQYKFIRTASHLCHTRFALCHDICAFFHIKNETKTDKH